MSEVLSHFKTLWLSRSATGICECVGISAAMLGGGHGWNQGRFGLAIDQIIEARMVLPNGTALTVSEKSNPDLFWAVRGAGHNFGLITELQYKIYDVDPQSTWAFEFYFFSEDKLEKIFTESNKMKKTQPENEIHWTYFVKLPFDPVHVSLGPFHCIVGGS